VTANTSMKTPPKFVEITPGGIWTLKNDNSIRCEILKKGRLNWDDTFAHLPELNGRKGIALDIGAFIGDTTPWFIDRGFKTLAFEPYPDAFLCLQQNIGSNCYCLAIGNGEGFTLQSSQAGNMGARSLSGCETGCRAIAIDELGLEDVGVIKIDVEGFEPNVLAGATETIGRCKPVIIVEFNLSALAKNGFEAGDIENRFKGWNSREIYRYDERQWDVVYSP
jgi:FkbM family methyltransferase